MALPPGLAGYVTGQQLNNQNEDHQLRQTIGMVGILNQIRAQQQEQEARGILASTPDINQAIPKLMQSGPVGMQYAGALSKLVAQQQTQAVQQSTLGLNAARMGEINQRTNNSANQTQAQGALARLLSGGGYQDANLGAPPPTSVIAPSDPNAPESPELLAQLREMDKSGQPVRVDSPNINNVKALSVLASPKDAVRSILAPASGSRIAPRQVADETSGTGWSWMDASGKKTPGAPPPFSPRAAGPTLGATPPGDYTKKGDEFLQTLPLEDRNFVVKLANYEIDPRTLSTRGGERERYLRMASQFDPQFDQKEYNTQYQAVNRFNTGKQGDTVRSLNVAIQHMDVARDLAKGLAQNDVRLFNAASNRFAEEFGRTGPTNFEAVKDILADEVTKGILGNGAGAQEDRTRMAAKIKTSNSPKQLQEALDQWTKLLAGQMVGLERQYKGATNRNDFKRFLEPRTVDAMTATGPVPTNAVVAPQAPPAVNPQGWKLHRDAKGNMAYVGPKGEIEEVK